MGPRREQKADGGSWWPMTQAAVDGSLAARLNQAKQGSLPLSRSFLLLIEGLSQDDHWCPRRTVMKCPEPLWLQLTQGLVFTEHSAARGLGLRWVAWGDQELEGSPHTPL